METKALFNKLKKLPDPQKKEVENFVDFLIYKSKSYPDVIGVNEENSAYNYINSIKSNSKNPTPIFGSGKGIFGKITDDFDEPLNDMKDYM